MLAKSSTNSPCCWFRDLSPISHRSNQSISSSKLWCESYTHITDITNLLFYEDLSDVVLVSHSYAGMMITGVAAITPERLGQLIYLDAYVPEEGESEMDLWPPEMHAEIEADAKNSHGLRPPPSPELLSITDREMADWVRPNKVLPAGSGLLSGIKVDCPATSAADRYTH